MKGLYLVGVLRRPLPNDLGVACARVIEADYLPTTFDNGVNIHPKNLRIGASVAMRSCKQQLREVNLQKETRFRLWLGTRR